MLQLTQGRVQQLVSSDATAKAHLFLSVYHCIIDRNFARGEKSFISERWCIFSEKVTTISVIFLKCFEDTDVEVNESDFNSETATATDGT